MTQPVDTVAQWIEAVLAGAPREHLAAPDFRYVGAPPSWAIEPLEPDATPAEASEALAREHVTLHYGEPQAGASGRVWIEIVWSRDRPGGRGSAGLHWVVLTVRDGLVSEVRFFAAEEDARRHAEHDPRSA